MVGIDLRQALERPRCREDQAIGVVSDGKETLLGKPGEVVADDLCDGRGGGVGADDRLGGGDQSAGLAKYRPEGQGDKGDQRQGHQQLHQRQAAGQPRFFCLHSHRVTFHLLRLGAMAKPWLVYTM